MQRHTQVRAISEGAMFLALIGMVLLINRQSANMLELLLYFLSIPVAVYTVRYGMKMACTFGIAALLLSFLLASMTTLFYVFCALCMGMVYGYGTLHKWKNQTLLCSMVGANLLSTYISVIMLSAFFGFDVYAETQYLLSLFPAMATQGALLQYALVIVLLSYCILALMQGILIHVLSNRLLVRLHIPVQPLLSLYEVHFPKVTIFFILGGLAGYIVCHIISVPDYVETLCLGYYCIAFLLAEAAGCMALLCKAMQKRKGKGVVFLLLVACFLPLTKELLAAYGIYDMLCDKKGKKVGS